MTEEEINEIIEKAKDKVETYISWGTDLASRLLAHWEKGSGKVFELSESDVARIMKTSQAQKAKIELKWKMEAYMRGRCEDMKPGSKETRSENVGTTKATYSKPRSKFDRSLDADLFYSFHNLYFDGLFQGELERSKCGETITFKGRMAVHIHDYYNFVNRKWKAIPGDSEATDWLFWVYQQYGKPAPFQVSGSYYESGNLSVKCPVKEDCEEEDGIPDPPTNPPPLPPTPTGTGSGYGYGGQDYGKGGY